MNDSYPDRSKLNSALTTLSIMNSFILCERLKSDRVEPIQTWKRLDLKSNISTRFVVQFLYIDKLKLNDIISGILAYHITGLVAELQQ